MSKLADKIFKALFGEINSTIESLSYSQKNMQTQIKDMAGKIHAIKADFDSTANYTDLLFDDAKRQEQKNQVISQTLEKLTDQVNYADLKIEHMSDDFLRTSASVSELKAAQAHTQADLESIWKKISVFEQEYVNEIDNLKKQISELKKPASIPVSVESVPVPVAADKPKKRAVAKQAGPVVAKIKTHAGSLPWSEFQSVLKRAIKIVPKKGILPVLNCVKIEFKANDTVIVSATDLDNYYTAILDSNHSHDLTGRTILINREQAEKLSKTKGQVFFFSGTDQYDSNSDRYTVKADNFKDYIYSLPAEDFPLFPKTDTSILKSETGFIPAVIKSRSAQATDAAKSILTGTVLVRDNYEKVSIASTDGYKLFVDQLPVYAESEWSELILGPQFCAFLSEFKTQEKTDLFWNEGNYIRLDLQSGEKIYSRLIEGKYPAFRKILPKQFKHTVRMKRGDLLNALIEAKPFVDKTTQVITFNFSFDQLKITSPVTVIEPIKQGEKHPKFKRVTTFEKTIDCTCLDTATTDSISFNRSYFEVALKQFNCEYITLCFNSEIQPAIISEMKYDDRQTMLMPIKP